MPIKVNGLRDAVDLLWRTVKQLDTSQTQCDGCGHARYVNWNHKQAHDALTGALSRIERAARLINQDGANGAQGANDEDDDS